MNIIINIYIYIYICMHAHYIYYSSPLLYVILPVAYLSAWASLMVSVPLCSGGCCEDEPAGVRVQLASPYLQREDKREETREEERRVEREERREKRREVRIYRHACSI